MPRVKLAPRDTYRWQTTLAIRVGDINYGGHLSNDAVVSLVHQARLLTLRELGAGETDLGDGQTGLIMTDLAVNFLAEGFLFDELTVDTVAEEVTSRGFRLCHRLRRGDEPVALVECGFLAFEYANHRRGRVPAPLQAALG